MRANPHIVLRYRRRQQIRVQIVKGQSKANISLFRGNPVGGIKIGARLGNIAHVDAQLRAAHQRRNVVGSQLQRRVEIIQRLLRFISAQKDLTALIKIIRIVRRKFNGARQVLERVRIVAAAGGGRAPPRQGSGVLRHTQWRIGLGFLRFSVRRLCRGIRRLIRRCRLRGRPQVEDRTAVVREIYFIRVLATNMRCDRKKSALIYMSAIPMSRSATRRRAFLISSPSAKSRLAKGAM